METGGENSDQARREVRQEVGGGTRAWATTHTKTGMKAINSGAGLSGKRWLIYVAGKRQEEGTVSER